MSAITPDSLKLCSEQLEEQADKLGEATTKLMVAVMHAQDGPWLTSRPHLQETALKQWQEQKQDEVDKIRETSSIREVQLLWD
jgi:hypothetical protein